MERNNSLHKLTIKNDEMMLDDFKIKGLKQAIEEWLMGKDVKAI